MDLDELLGSPSSEFESVLHFVESLKLSTLARHDSAWDMERRVEFPTEPKINKKKKT